MRFAARLAPQALSVRVRHQQIRQELTRVPAICTSHIQNTYKGPLFTSARGDEYSKVEAFVNTRLLQQVEAV